MSGERWSARVTLEGSDLRIRFNHDIRLTAQTARELAAHLLMAAELATSGDELHSNEETHDD